MLRICFALTTAFCSLLPALAAHAEDDPPRVLRAEEGFATPEGYVEDNRLFRALWLTGTIGSAASWGASVIASGWFYGFTKDDSFLVGMIPLVGSFSVAAEADADTISTVMFAALGAVHVTSVVLLIAGMSMKQTVWVLDKNAPASAKVQLSPEGVRVDY